MPEFFAPFAGEGDDNYVAVEHLRLSQTLALEATVVNINGDVNV